MQGFVELINSRIDADVLEHSSRKLHPSMGLTHDAVVTAVDVAQAETRMHLNIGR